MTLTGENKNATIIDGGVSGKCIHVTADSVIISGFTIQNGTDGVYLDSSDGCNIEGNIIADNGNGISIYNSHNNLICHNNLIENGNQAYDNTGTNQWDNGYPSGGNYWSDYTGYDHYSGPNQDIRGGDGIIDAPYSINAGAQDKYPFMLTDIIALEVIGNTPSGSSVPVNTPITITFSEAMDHKSVESAFSISPSTVGRYSWSGNTMTHTPNSNLEINTMYTITIGTDAKDLAGNNLQSPYSWQFTTTSLEPSDSIYNGDFEIIDPSDSSNPDGWTVELGGRDPPGWGLYNDVSSGAYYSGEHSIHIRLVGYSNQYCYGIIKSPLINTVQGDLVWYQSQKTDFDASDIECTIMFYDENDNLVRSKLYYTDTTTSQAGPGCGGGPGDSDMSPPAVIADNGGPACGGGDWYKFSSDIPEIDTDKFRFEIQIYQWEAPSKLGDGDACGSACYVGFDNFCIVSKSAEEVIFADDFDTYATGSFPSSGGWNLKYNGMGNSYQVVDNSKSVSSPNSLKLEGQKNWAACADHALSETPDQVIFEADIKVTRPDGGTDGWANAYVVLVDPDVGWGTHYGRVLFGADQLINGKIPYNFDQWYHVKAKVDMTNRKNDVWIDDVFLGTFDITSDGYYKSIRLDADNSGHTRAWFDNVKVLSS